MDTVTAEQIITFVRGHAQGVTTAQAGVHFDMRRKHIAQRLGRLAAYGRLERTVARDRGRYTKQPVGKYAVWRVPA